MHLQPPVAKVQTEHYAAHSGEHGAYQTLLEEGDYSRADKKVDRSVAPIYWLSVVVIYLAISFLTFKWHMTWIIWPVVGVLYGLIAEIFKRKNNKSRFPRKQISTAVHYCGIFQKQ